MISATEKYSNILRNATNPPSPPSSRSKTTIQTQPHILSYTTIPSGSPAKPTPLQKPIHLLSFSKTPNFTLEFTDLALRYFVEPPIGARLDYGFERWVPRVEGRSRLDGLVKAFARLRDAGGEGVEADVDVVAWRGVMTRILIAPYEERDGWEMNVMHVGGTLYFEEHCSEEIPAEMKNMTLKQRRQMYHGYAFESYCTSDTPVRPLQQQSSNSTHHEPPGWGGDVDTNTRWFNVVRTKLGDMGMVIAGEYTKETDTFLELKTCLVIRPGNNYDEVRFQKTPKPERKLLKSYFQSLLLGVPEVLVGFRTHSGVLKSVQPLKTIEIPRSVLGKPGSWDPLVCLDWGHRFLTFIKSVVRNHASYTGAAERDSESATVWRVKFKPRIGVTVEVLERAGVQDVEDGEDRVGFLPRWYWKEAQRVASGQDSNEA